MAAGAVYRPLRERLHGVDTGWCYHSLRPAQRWAASAEAVALAKRASVALGAGQSRTVLPAFRSCVGKVMDIMEALILVDVQNDFLPGGALAVPEGDQVIPVINDLMSRFELVVATRDWHPADHLSFASQHPGRKVGEIIDLDGLEQILWPDHCVQGTEGAAFAEGLNADDIHHVLYKGTDRRIDSYSGFFDNGHRKATGLADLLDDRGVKQVTIAGLATDYCVKFTVLDACRLGYETRVVRDGIRAVNLNPGDGDKAIDEMREAGAQVVEM